MVKLVKGASARTLGSTGRGIPSGDTAYEVGAVS